MTKRIPLAYNKEFNDYGFIVSDDKLNENYEDIIKKSFEELTCKFDKNRRLIIYSWGEKVKEHIQPDCQVIFDLTKFSTKTDRKDIKKYNGCDEIIQNSIIQHPNFITMLDNVIRQIENNNLNSISFLCNYGKHRSVGFAEILKKYYYTNAIIKHLRFP